jgi:hypothetical protein
MLQDSLLALLLGTYSGLLLLHHLCEAGAAAGRRAGAVLAAAAGRDTHKTGFY